MRGKEEREHHPGDELPRAEPLLLLDHVQQAPQRGRKANTHLTLHYRGVDVSD